MSAGMVSVLDGETFAVSDRRGDMDASPTETAGLFHMDTRYLSRWILTVDGKRPGLLSTDDLAYHAAQFFLVPTTGTIYVDAPLSIIRRRAVGHGFHEDLELLNHAREPRDLEVRVEVGSDFADLFEVKALRPKRGLTHVEPTRHGVRLRYERDGFWRSTEVAFEPAPAVVEAGRACLEADLEPQGSWRPSS